MKLRPSPAPLVDAFDEVLPGPPVVRRKMFGYPAAFVNGNMFFGLFQDKMIVRLPEPARKELLAEGGLAFEPMPGRPMREYMVLPPEIVGRRGDLTTWVAKALSYGKVLPPKASNETKKNKPAAGREEPKRPGKRPRTPARR